MQESSFPQSNTIADKVQIDLDVLRPLMLHRIARHVSGADVVTINDSSFRHWLMQFKQKMSEPHGFSDAVRNSSIFRFRAGSGDGLLSL